MTIDYHTIRVRYTASQMFRQAMPTHGMLATSLHGNVRACVGPQALMSRVHEVVDAAGMAGVNVMCLQEAWTMPFACVP